MLERRELAMCSLEIGVGLILSRQRSDGVKTLIHREQIQKDEKGNAINE